MVPSAFLQAADHFENLLGHAFVVFKPFLLAIGVIEAVKAHERLAGALDIVPVGGVDGDEVRIDTADFIQMAQPVQAFKISRAFMRGIILPSSFTPHFCGAPKATVMRLMVPSV